MGKRAWRPLLPSTLAPQPLRRFAPPCPLPFSPCLPPLPPLCPPPPAQPPVPPQYLQMTKYGRLVCFSTSSASSGGSSSCVRKGLEVMVCSMLLLVFQPGPNGAAPLSHKAQRLVQWAMAIAMGSPGCQSAGETFVGSFVRPNGRHKGLHGACGGGRTVSRAHLTAPLKPLSPLHHQHRSGTIQR